MADIINDATPIETFLRGKHPRLLVEEKKLFLLKKKQKKQPYNILLKRVITSANYWAANGWNDGKGDVRGLGDGLANMALLWKLTHKQKWFDAALANAKKACAAKDWGTDLVFGHIAHGCAIVFDWLYNDISLKDKNFLKTHLVHHAKVFFDEWRTYNSFASFGYTFNHMSVPLTGFASIAYALYNEEENIAPWIKLVMEKARLMADSLGPDGISPEGTAYGQYHAEWFARLLVMVRDLSGIDLIKNSLWWKNYPRSTFYLTTSRDTWGNKDEVFITFGDADRHHWYGPDPQLRLCAGIFRDSLSQWLASEFVKRNAVKNTGAYLNLLWHDETVPAKRPAKLPRFCHFKDQDIVIIRSSWNGNENVLGFKCGPHSGYHNLRFNHNVSGGHMHPAAGAFTIFAHGEFVLIESNYSFKQTAYENTILINGTGQIGEGGDWFEDLEFRRGHPVPHIISAGVMNDGRGYVIGDATNAYPKEVGLKNFIRHIYELSPNDWLLIDEIELLKESHVQILFHGDYQFELQNNTTALQKCENACLLIRSIKNSADMTFKTSEQYLRGVGHPNRNRTIGLLSLEGANVKKAISVVHLHVFSVGNRKQIFSTEVKEISDGIYSFCGWGKRKITKKIIF